MPAGVGSPVGRAMSTTGSTVSRRSRAPDPRFAHLKPRVDTGSNMRKLMEKYEGTSGPNARAKQTHTYFRRIKPLDLERRLAPDIECEESIYAYDLDEASAAMSLGGASVAASIVSHAADASTSASIAAAAAGASVLCLDCRSFEQYSDSHVRGARHYDLAQLSHSTNHFPKELYFFRGPAGGDKLIVLYDADGKGLDEAANAFVQRGIENTCAPPTPS